MTKYKRIMRIISEIAQSKNELARAQQLHRDATGTPKITNTRRAVNRARLTHLIGMNVAEKAILQKSVEAEKESKKKPAPKKTAKK